MRCKNCATNVQTERLSVGYLLGKRADIVLERIYSATAATRAGLTLVAFLCICVARPWYAY